MEHTKHIDDTQSIFLPLFLSIQEGRHTLWSTYRACNYSVICYWHLRTTGAARNIDFVKLHIRVLFGE